MKKFALLLVSLVALMVGCATIQPPNPGFILVLTQIDRSTLFAQERPLPGVDTEGILRFADDDASGYREEFRDDSGVSGQIRVENGRAPGTWKITEFNGPCYGQYTYWPIKRGDFTDLPCIERSLKILFSPAAINADAPPTTFQIFGSGFSGAYGMPTVQFRNYLGTLVTQVRATRVDEGLVIANATTLRNLPSGSYYAQVWNVKAHGSSKLAGTATMRVHRPQPPPNPCDVQHIQTDDGQQIDLPSPTCD